MDGKQKVSEAMRTIAGEKRPDLHIGNPNAGLQRENVWEIIFMEGNVANRAAVRGDTIHVAQWINSHIKNIIIKIEINPLG